MSTFQTFCHYQRRRIQASLARYGRQQPRVLAHCVTSRRERNERLTIWPVPRRPSLDRYDRTAR